jgi:hypothetical protein
VNDGPRSIEDWREFTLTRGPRMAAEAFLLKLGALAPAEQRAALCGLPDAVSLTRRFEHAWPRRDAALGDVCNSCFFPGSFYYERVRVGVEHIANNERPQVAHHWPQLLLDYRCHVPGGAIGTNYPPKARGCLPSVCFRLPADVACCAQFAECIAEWSRMSAAEMY